MIDDTAGYHARHTEWWWSAGVGAGADGIALAWNLVRASTTRRAAASARCGSRGEPHEVAPVRFARDRRARSSRADGSRLSFAAEAERARRENLLIVSSDYRAPFGTFSGTLPGGIALASGLGVVEHHRAKW